MIRFFLRIACRVGAGSTEELAVDAEGISASDSGSIGAESCSGEGSGFIWFGRSMNRVCGERLPSLSYLRSGR